MCKVIICANQKGGVAKSTSVVNLGIGLANKGNADFLRDFLSEKKPKPRKVVFNQKKLDNYFTPDMSNEDIEELIVKLLDEWKEKGEPR